MCARAPDSAIGRALLTAMASVADVTFKEVVREACLSRDHFMAWTDAAGGEDAAAALETGSKSYCEQAARLREAKVSADSDHVDRYLGLFLTEERAPRK